MHWCDTVIARDIAQDQLHPHKLRKDRQIKNPFRKHYVQNKIRELGGYLKTKETGKYRLVRPGGEFVREVLIESEVPVEEPNAGAAPP